MHPSERLTIARVHLRRALLLFALVLGLTALATAVAPSPRSSDNGAAVAPPPPEAVPPETTVAFRSPVPRGRIPRRKILSTTHILVQVSADQGGQATIPALGQTAPVTASAPAGFDLLDLSPGSYDVMFQPALATTSRIGTIVSKP
jgi:hypothetical protein